ncbi:Ima1 N-terminal domain-containing protein [Linnemannia elongata]|nr:Ima1 N-terminal domain-containing protein [Linnemannia elongata]
MQRNRPGPAQFKAAFAGGPAQDITVRPRSRPATTLRPINHPPGWLETVLMRPIRVECWSCLRPSWLHRGQRDATPHDWTCLNCQTHQRRDKDGNIESVPEMFDSTLNEDISERIARSRTSRNRARHNGSTPSDSQDDVFCDKCSSNQRVIYQLLSNYIPDEDDENYEAFFENADAYRRQVEERYPLVCSDCLDRVQQRLSQQNYRIKSSLLNATLSKSRGDRISPTRKYPDAPWVLTGASWIISHATWVAVELGVLLHLPNIGPFEHLRQRRYSTGHSTFNTITGTISKINTASVWPWASTFGRPFRDLQEHEYRMLLLLALALVSVTSLFWDPLQLMRWRSPRARIRTRWYHSWTKRAALPLLVLQFMALFSKHLWQESIVGYGVLVLLHTAYLVAFFTCQQALDPIELRFSPSVPSSPPPEPSTYEHVRTDSRPNRSLAAARQGSFVNRSFSPPVLSRTASDPTNRFAASSSPSWADYSGSQSDSQDANQMNWSPKKPASSPPTRLPAVFGTYRDSSQRTAHDDPFLQGMARLGQDSTNTYTSHTSTHHNDRNNDNKFRSRAYEPSPLANPSLITNMSLGNISFGEMLGFPSAKFQQPENHFAHRSQPDSGRSEPWAFRKPAETNSSSFGMDRIHRRGQHSRPSGLSRNADVDMEGEDDDDEDNDDNARRGTFGQRGQNTGSDSDLFGNSFSAMGRSSQARDSWTVDGREAFAAQTYFPPEPETGLEDNFFGVVKIVDDYLPPKQEPRTIDARNLMLKKRMAKRWLVFILICRALSLLKPDGQWLDKLLWVSHHVFAIVLLHATAFWVLDESRALQRYWNRKPTKEAEKKTAVAVKSKDPFEPTPLDKICSYILMTLLSLRVVSLSWAVVSKAEQGVGVNDSCIRGLDLSSGKSIEYCQDVSLDDRYSDLDWPIGAVKLAMPWAYDGGYDLRTLATYAGWIHDGAIVALFGVLMVYGAGAPSTHGRSKAPEGRKVKL